MVLQIVTDNIFASIASGVITAGKRSDIKTLFADISGFTSFCEGETRPFDGLRNIGSYIGLFLFDAEVKACALCRAAPVDGLLPGLAKHPLHKKHRDLQWQ